MNIRFLIFVFSVHFLCLNDACGQTYKDVEPIFLSKCASCHNQKNGETPFSLESFDDIKKRIRTVREVIHSNYMPPWMPDPHYRDFANNRQLTPGEKEKILEWIDRGAPMGKRISQQSVKKADPTPQRVPDLVLRTHQPFIVKGDNRERFVLFKVPFELLADQSIEGVEFYSNNKRLVHHVNYLFSSIPDTSVDLYAGDPFIDNSAQTDLRKLMQYERYQTNPVFYTGWIPGASTEYYPKDFGWTMPKRGVVVFTVHYAAIASDEASTVGVNLYFKKKPANRQVRIISLGSGGIGEKDIFPRFILSPNEIQTFSLQVKTPEDQSILYAWPHMHYLGKEFRAFAVTPANDTIPLIHIPQWNFEWQEMYRFKKLIKIPAGSTVNIVGTYDNTVNNPQNPNSPPKYVFSTGNMTATDEMLTFLLIYVPYQTGDEEISLE